MDLHPFRILSVCSGVGGIELGFKLAEPTARTICYVEIEAFACEILARRMEEERLDKAPIWTNLKTFDGKPWRGKVDCITGGYPCQPFSVAGKKLGDQDPRHLWPEIKRLITEIEPPICFFENVGGHLRLGFEEVANDLSSLGYQIKAGLFTAAEVGAPHKRERLFILAYRDSFGSSLQSDRNAAALEAKSATEENGRNQSSQTTANCSSGSLADCGINGCAGGSDNISERHLQTNLDGKPQENQQEWNRRIAGTCQNCSNVADCSDFICQWREQQGSRSWKSETEIGSDDSELANSESSRTRKHQPELWQGIEKHSRELENTKCLRCTRWSDGTFGGKECQIETSRHFCSHCKILGDATSAGLEGHCQCQCSDQFNTWPPSPTDYERWDRIKPDLKPAIHRMVDGLADRVDEIRACGNGVVPLVAAYAWRTLTDGMCLTKD